MEITRRSLLRGTAAAGVGAALPAAAWLGGTAQGTGSQPFIGELMLFAGTFDPVGWARCDGRLLPISENDALFTLIGTTYGGDGQESFALPDLQGRVVVHRGTGSDGISYLLAQQGGVEDVTLTVNQLPPHSHLPMGSTARPTSRSPQQAVFGSSTTARQYASSLGASSGPLAANAIAPAGGSQPHDNTVPSLAMTWCISLYGLFPPPN